MVLFCQGRICIIIPPAPDPFDTDVGNQRHGFIGSFVIKFGGILIPFEICGYHVHDIVFKLIHEIRCKPYPVIYKSERRSDISRGGVLPTPPFPEVPTIA